MGDDDAASSFATDQRGFPRLFGAHVDIGAAELQVVVVPAAPTIVCNANTNVSNDPFALPPQDIHKVEMTILDGRVVYKKD